MYFLNIHEQEGSRFTKFQKYKIINIWERQFTIYKTSKIQNHKYGIVYSLLLLSVSVYSD